MLLASRKLLQAASNQAAVPKACQDRRLSKLQHVSECLVVMILAPRRAQPQPVPAKAFGESRGGKGVRPEWLQGCLHRGPSGIEAAARVKRGVTIRLCQEAHLFGISLWKTTLLAVASTWGSLSGFRKKPTSYKQARTWHSPFCRRAAASSCLFLQCRHSYRTGRSSPSIIYSCSNSCLLQSSLADTGLAGTRDGTRLSVSATSRWVDSMPNASRSTVSSRLGKASEPLPVLARSHAMQINTS